MKVGKITENVLKRSVLKQINHRREEVILRAGVGEDCAVMELKPDEVFVISTDPITGTVNDIGTLAVNITANDLASGGSEPVGIMISILLPEDTNEPKLLEMMKEIENACEKLSIEVMGGHTEVTRAVNQPIITVTGVGKMLKDDLISTTGAKVGQDIVMTKYAGLEGTVIIANEKNTELRTRYAEDYIEEAKSLLSDISIVKEAKIAKQIGTTAMHDVTEGGVFGAIWEIAVASDVGIEVDLKKIPIKQETIEICECFDINPYMLISSGSLMIATDYGSRLVEELSKEGIVSAVIGKVTSGNDKVIINGDEKRYLEPPKSDELYKIYDDENTVTKRWSK